MSVLDLILLALNSLKASKMRAFLTMLGIIIGIGSVIAIMTVGNSLTGSLADSMSSMGVNSITVSLTQKSSEDSTVNLRLFLGTTIQQDDLINIDMIREYKQAYGSYIDAISLVETVGNTSMNYDGISSNVKMTGVNEESAAVQAIEIIQGRYIKDSDKERNVCVIADQMAEELFGNLDPIGRQLTTVFDQEIISFYVVGVYKYSEDGSVSMDGNSTYPVYIPLYTAKTINHSFDGFQSFTVAACSEVSTTEFMKATESFFQSFYTRNDSYTIKTSSMEVMVETMTEMMSTVSLAVAAIAAISLIVGGIGVMNIMLVSITERTREIGTRIALGATRNMIRLQFIVESMMICLIGGCIGVVIGVGLSAVGCSMLGYSVKPSIEVITIAVLFSLSIGVFFGYYPANKAAKMNPIDALRYE